MSEDERVKEYEARKRIRKEDRFGNLLEIDGAEFLRNSSGLPKPLHLMTQEEIENERKYGPWLQAMAAKPFKEVELEKLVLNDAEKNGIIVVKGMQSIDVHHTFTLDSHFLYDNEINTKLSNKAGYDTVDLLIDDKSVLIDMDSEGIKMGKFLGKIGRAEIPFVAKDISYTWFDVEKERLKVSAGVLNIMSSRRKVRDTYELYSFEIPGNRYLAQVSRTSQSQSRAIWAALYKESKDGILKAELFRSTSI